MLDWKLILDKYEDAWHDWFEFLCDWNMHSGDKWCVDDLEFINSPWESQVGWYYKFFESKGIYSSVFACDTKIGGCQDCYEFGGYYYDIYVSDNRGGKTYEPKEEEYQIKNENHWSKFEYRWKTRKECEINLITKLYEILQEEYDKNDPEKRKARRKRKISKLLKTK